MSKKTGWSFFSKVMNTKNVFFWKKKQKKNENPEKYIKLSIGRIKFEATVMLPHILKGDLTGNWECQSLADTEKQQI